MKNFIGVIFCILSVTLIGCNTPSNNDINTTIVDLNEEELSIIAKEQTENLLAGNYNEVVKLFTPEMKKGFDEATLKTTVESITGSLGKHIGFYSEVDNIVDQNYVAEIVHEYENNGLIVTIAFNNKKEISGLYLNYVPINQTLASNELFEEVSVKIGDTMPLDAILTLPKDISNPPVVLMVHGSGPNDKNSTVYQNAPFKDIAHGLASEGIATLRYDKRTFVYPDEMAELGSDVTIREEVLDDVTLAIDLLKNDTRINPSAIFVLGHSLGGGLTPVIAVENQDIAGIISIAGTLEPMYEVSYAQNKDMETYIETIELEEAIKNQFKDQMEQVEKDIEILRADFSDVPNDEILLGIHAGYQKSAKELAGINFINDVDVPILVLQGSADFQIKSDTDFKLWKEVLKDKENVTFNLYDNLNHLMMPTSGAKDITDYQAKSSVSEQVIDDIALFVNENVN